VIILIKSYSFYSYKLNKNKYNQIKDYAIKVIQNKNCLSQYLYDNLKPDLFYGNLTKNNFINKTKHMRNNIGATTFQQAQMDVYTKYMNQLNTIAFDRKSKKNIYKVIKYLVKIYRDDNLLIYIKNSNNVFHQKTQSYIEKYGERLINLIKRIQNKLLDKFKLVVFKKLTYNDINQLYEKHEMLEMSNLKLTNAVINLQIPNVDRIVIPIRYSSEYHDFKINYTYNEKGRQRRYSYKLKIENNRIKIQVAKEIKEEKINCTCNNIIGIDVNSKHNLFALSDGHLIDYDRKIVDKISKNKKDNDRIQETKKSRGLSTEYGKKQLLLSEKNKRRCTAHIEKKVSELLKYCQDNNIDHIVLEDLKKSNGRNYCKTNNDINYNDLFNILRLYTIKEIIKRMSKNIKYGVTVSLTNARYTSQQCNKCGHISKENRKTQETFCCVKCNHTCNADLNASLNIRDRILKVSYRKVLHKEVETNRYENKPFVSKVLFKEQLINNF